MSFYSYFVQIRIQKVPGGGLGVSKELITQLCPTLRPHGLSVRTSLPMRFSRQEYWSGLPFPSPGDLLHPGIETGSPVLQAEYFIN